MGVELDVHGVRTHVRTRAGRQLRFRRSRSLGRSSSGRVGNCGSRSFRVSSSSWETAHIRYHLRSAGTTNHGAASVLRALDGLLVGGLELRPALAVLDVGLGELPALVGAVEAAQLAVELVVAADVQEDLDDRAAVVGELALEGVDLLEAGAPHVLGNELAGADGDDVLVVGAVEDADVAQLRELLADPPQEVMVELLLRRRAEAGDVQPLRVHAAEAALDDPVLAGGVHALQDQEHAPARALDGRLGHEPLLEVGEHVARVVTVIARRLLAALGRAGRGGGVDRVQVDGTGREAELRADRSHRGGA